MCDRAANPQSLWITQKLGRRERQQYPLLLQLKIPTLHNHFNGAERFQGRRFVTQRNDKAEVPFPLKDANCGCFN